MTLHLLQFLFREQKHVTKNPTLQFIIELNFNGSIKHLPYTGITFTDTYEMLLLERHVMIVISAMLKHGP